MSINYEITLPLYYEDKAKGTEFSQCGNFYGTREQLEWTHLSLTCLYNGNMYEH